MTAPPPQLFQQAVNDINHDPAAAVARARADADDVAFVNLMASMPSHPEVWPGLRDAGVVELFLDLMLRLPERRNLSQQLPPCAVYLQALFNCLVGIQRSPSGFKNPKNVDVVKQMLSESSAICQKLVKEEEAHVRGTEPFHEDVRKFVMSWTQAIWNAAGMFEVRSIQTDLKDAHVVVLITWCWLYSQSSENTSRASMILREILEPPTKSDLEAMVAAASGSCPIIVGRFTTTLLNEDFVDEYLVAVMDLMSHFAGATSHAELSCQFGADDAGAAVLAAARRQVVHDDKSDMTWRVLDLGGFLIANIANDAPSPNATLTKLIGQLSLIEFLSGTFLRYARASRPIMPWTQIIALLKHTCTCLDKTCRVKTSPTYKGALHSHLRDRWWPTLLRLHHTQTGPGNDIGKEWLALGQLVALDIDSERRRFEAGEVTLKGCWWDECLAELPSDEPQLRACSGCRGAKYCSPACQTRDWKGHKQLCTKLKAKISP